MSATKTAVAKPAESRPIRLKSWKEVREYFAAHLKPIRHNAKGEPIYSNDDIKKLNVLLPDDA